MAFQRMIWSFKKTGFKVKIKATVNNTVKKSFRVRVTATVRNNV